MSPEKILLYLCFNAKVIGISASGTIETVTGNYDLKYLKSKLGKFFYEINEDEKERINLFINNRLGNYNNVKIIIDKCDITEKNYSDKMDDIFDVNISKYILYEISKYFKENSFIQARYCKIAYAINYFFNNKIKSFLFLTNVSMNNNLEFNFNCINNIFKQLKPQKLKNAYCYSLDGNLEKFESLKKDIKQRLKNGDRVFVVSTYQTLGAGQNLQYEYDEKFEKTIKTINDNSYGKAQKDFDAIFLDKPTNMFVNMNGSPDEEQLLKFIYQVKCLEENGYFNVDEASREIKKGIRILYHSSAQKIPTPRSIHIYMHTAKIVMQAIGRICRTNKKNKNIFVLFDTQIEPDLALCKKELLKRPLNYEFKELLNFCTNSKEVVDETIFKINNSKIKKNSDKIKSMLHFKSSSDILKWEELREIVLKYPYDNINVHNEYDIYCELEKPSKYYYYNKDEDGNYNITGNEVNQYCLSEEEAHLQTLMSIKAIKSYFVKKQYATSFEESRYILLPNVFYQIYLGALGEVVGEFAINRYLEKYNLRLSRINDVKRYEKFDFVFSENKYIDFKYWSGNYDKDREQEVLRCIKKLDDCGGSYGYIINILKPKNYDPKIYISSDSRLIIIPYLYDPETKKWNIEGLELLLK